MVLLPPITTCLAEPRLTSSPICHLRTPLAVILVRSSHCCCCVHARDRFDEERLHGNIQKKMCDGIDQSFVCVVFITQNYVQKVGSNNMADNCKKEFEYSERRLTAAAMIPVMMEAANGNASSCRSPSTWGGPVGMCLGGQLYVDLAADVESEDFDRKVGELADRIMQIVEDYQP